MSTSDPQHSLPVNGLVLLDNIWHCPRCGDLCGHADAALDATIRQRKELVELLWSISGQLADFKDPYLDPDGRDCKAAVANLIAEDIAKFLIENYKGVAFE